MLEHDHLAHEFGQLRQGIDHPQQFVIPLGPVAGRRLIGGQPRREPRGRMVDVSFQRPLLGDVPLVPIVMLERTSQRPGQDPPQPGDQHFGLWIAHFRQGRVGAQRRLLDHVICVELSRRQP